MIHHISIPVRDVQHVAAVMSELTGWKARPFLGPVPGALMLFAEDGRGTAIELYPEGTFFSPAEGEQQATIGQGEAVAHVGFHALISVDADPAKIQGIGDREGWRTLQCWRGPPGRPLFELFEFWIENRVMLELATPDMLANYLNIATAAGQDAVVAKMRAS